MSYMECLGYLANLGSGLAGTTIGWKSQDRIVGRSLERERRSIGHLDQKNVSTKRGPLTGGQSVKYIIIELNDV